MRGDIGIQVPCEDFGDLGRDMHRVGFARLRGPVLGIRSQSPWTFLELSFYAQRLSVRLMS